MKRIVILVFLIVSCSVLFISWMRLDKDSSEIKIQGVNLEAPRNPVDIEALIPLKEIHTEWVSVIPYAFTDPANPKVHFDYHQLWWGEGIQGATATIKMAQDLGLKIMLKPHVWVRGQGWAGDFDAGNEENWKLWEKSYEDYIITYARLADSLDVELFCIGTEHRKSAKERPGFWVSLAKKVRSIYKGKITYAANWDNHENITFWPAMDYIGVDAYFPLCERKTPTVESVMKGWVPITSKLKNMSKQYDKLVLFTEYGYRSMDYAADGHWKYSRDTLLTNNEAQANAYKGLYLTFWDKPWFAGGFLWKWHLQTVTRQDRLARAFTPQNKPALEIIRKRYKKGNGEY